MEQLKEFIATVKSHTPNNCTRIFFSRKVSSNGNTKYVTHQPTVSNEVQLVILNTVFPYIEAQLEKDSIVAYNPIGVLDGELEKISITQIPMFSEFIDSIDTQNLYREMDSLKIDKIGFYCIEVNVDGSPLYIFRKFQKLKKLRSGILTRIANNALNVIENDFLGIDEFTDMIAFGDDLFLLNHISLERIFDYRDEFLRKTNEALGEILSKDVLVNIEQFTEDCCSDIRIMKRFTTIMTKDRLPMFFDNYDKVPEIVSELGLDIDFNEQGKLIYRERCQLFHIVNLLSDSYFKSLLANRTGVAMIEGEV
ncbi:Kiwa anti-phage protein KwaB-like domain-containing protein [Pectinatus frisingensis]|uniref:Kiwa anti-phage protein KwaB-like domain-containing protein n=1 Tax=Pectinatus frisingensis TaxID=865 RepID=UPI0018C5246C|nr:Kiwa anti-phage protein KwaB-like domain-containing protein [Pectinatus frisingensis]